MATRAVVKKPPGIRSGALRDEPCPKAPITTGATNKTVHVQSQDRADRKGNDCVPRRVTPNHQREGCDAGNDKDPHMPTPESLHRSTWVRAFVHNHRVIQRGASVARRPRWTIANINAIGASTECALLESVSFIGQLCLSFGRLRLRSGCG
jgi:hypothetical protein